MLEAQESHSLKDILAMNQIVDDQAEAIIKKQRMFKEKSNAYR